MYATCTAYWKNKNKVYNICAHGGAGARQISGSYRSRQRTVVGLFKHPPKK